MIRNEHRHKKGGTVNEVQEGFRIYSRQKSRILPTLSDTMLSDTYGRLDIAW
jgi:hypothetical protein